MTFRSARALLLVLSSLSPFLHRSRALIPRPCAANATRPGAVCCPAPPGHALPCGGPGWGECRRVRPFREVPIISADEAKRLRLDDRAAWPSRFFTFLCECHGARFGYACHECWPGRSGIACAHPAPPRHRRNFLSLSPRERLILRGVLSLSRRLTSDFVVPAETGRFRRDPVRYPVVFRNATVHEALVFVHYFAARPTSLSGGKCGHWFDFNHDGPGFPTWHRLFLALWERALAGIAKDYFGVENFAVPYWDWTDRRGCEPCADDLVGDLESANSASFLRRWTVYCPSAGDRSPWDDCSGCDEMVEMDAHGRPQPHLQRKMNRLRLPTTAQVLSTLQRRVYYDLNEINHLRRDRRCASFVRYYEGNCADEVIRRGNFTMHNAVHRSTGGPFRLTRTSPNDPLFLLHHAQMDRVMQAWFRRHRPTARDIPNFLSMPGHCRDCFLVGILPLVTHGELLVDMEALGITYDSMLFGKLDASNISLS